MPELGCTVKSCTHNWEEKCDKDCILVEGKHACTSSETCCGSFEDAKDFGYKNVTHDVKMHTDVDCEATDCVYNEDKRCAAGHIGIAGAHACECSQTECSSFKPRK